MAVLRALQDLFHTNVASTLFQVPMKGTNPNHGLTSQGRGACCPPSFDTTRSPKLHAMLPAQDQMRQKHALQSMHQERDIQCVQQGDGLGTRRRNYVGKHLPSLGPGLFW